MFIILNPILQPPPQFGTWNIILKSSEERSQIPNPSLRYAGLDQLSVWNNLNSKYYINYLPQCTALHPPDVE